MNRSRTRTILNGTHDANLSSTFCALITQRHRNNRMENAQLSNLALALGGQIEEIQLGDVMAHVVVRLGDKPIESVITRRSADELKPKKGDAVSAVVEASEVMIRKD